MNAGDRKFAVATILDLVADGKNERARGWLSACHAMGLFSNDEWRELMKVVLKGSTVGNTVGAVASKPIPLLQPRNFSGWQPDPTSDLPLPPPKRL